MDVKIALNCLWAEVARYNENSRVREAWQTLNTFVLAQQPTNNARDEIIQDCGNCYYGYVHQGPFKCLRPDDVPCCNHSYWKCITSPVA